MPIKSATKAKPALHLPAKVQGFTESQATRLALARLGQETLPRYEPDSGLYSSYVRTNGAQRSRASLTVEQLKVIKTLKPRGRVKTRESLFS
jgi:hypothetical protein